VVTVIDWPVAVVDQRLSVALLEVRVTLPDNEQKVVGPLAVITGVGGTVLIVT
jgi:hypothetical protein